MSSSTSSLLYRLYNSLEHLADGEHNATAERKSLPASSGECFNAQHNTFSFLPAGPKQNSTALTISSEVRCAHDMSSPKAVKERAAWEAVAKDTMFCFALMGIQQDAEQKSASDQGGGLIEKRNWSTTTVQCLWANVINRMSDRGSDMSVKSLKKRKIGEAPGQSLPTVSLPLAVLRRCRRRALSDCSSGTTGLCFATSDGVVHDLRHFWMLHTQAEARARLVALRNNDAEGFAEHVSFLKITSLLQIMEKTNEFMRRIGLRIQERASDAESSTAITGDVASGTETCATGIGESSSFKQTDAYRRFKAYVASTRDEFKLVHTVDVFVKQQPHGLRATLLPHQMDGLRFLASLHANRINGILADEMGLGKTIQTIAFLLYLKENAGVGVHQKGKPIDQCMRYPHLVMAPLSVVREWREACEQFVPDTMKVAVLQELDDPVSEAPLYDIVLMPIHAVRSVRWNMSKVRWGYLVVDEAHRAVANLNTVTSQSILRLPCERRLVLTGTPLNSNLQELWSLLTFLNPNVFTAHDTFDEVFSRPFATYDTKETDLSSEERGLLVIRLHHILRPFLLRRTKNDVDRTLRMTRHVLYCPLSIVQVKLLELLREQRRLPCYFRGTPEPLVGRAASDCAAAGRCTSEEELPAAVRRGYDAPLESILDGAMANNDPPHRAGLGSYRLSYVHAQESTAQMLCSHAFLVPFPSLVVHHNGLDSSGASFPARDGGALALVCSGKFLVLDLLLSRLMLANTKAVLFTHWLDTIDLLVDYMHSRRWSTRFEVLTGNTAEEDRQTRVRHFREDPSCLFFCISMKAGGCGINLQVAHIVILLDRDYTASNEDQALARVYRIGQRYTVRALFLTTDDPAEERVTVRATQKDRPRKAIVEGGMYSVGEVAQCDSSVPESECSSRTLEGANDIRIGINEATLHYHSLAVAEEIDTKNVFLYGLRCTSREGSSAAAHAVATAGWEALYQLVMSLDALIMTTDGCCDDVGRLLVQHLPPKSHEEYLMRLKAEECVCACPLCRSVVSDRIISTALHCATSATEDSVQSEMMIARCHINIWTEFWEMWFTAARGPRILMDALRASIDNDAAERSEAYLVAQKKRKNKQDEAKLQFLLAEPPVSFYEKCWEAGVDDEYEIKSLYLKRSQKGSIR